MLQELCDTGCSNRCLNLICNFLQVVNDTLALIHVLNLLREITNTYRLTNIQNTSCRHKVTINQIEQGRFPDTIIPNNTDTITILHDKIEITENLLAIFISKIDMLEVHYFLTNTASLKVNFKIVIIDRLVNLTLKLLKTIDTSLLLGRTCLWLRSHPCQLLLIELLFLVKSCCISFILFSL